MTRKNKSSQLRTFRVYVDGKMEGTFTAYTMKSMCHQAKQKFGSKGDIHVEEI